MISFNKYVILAIAGAVLLSLALVRAEGEADEQPEAKVGEAFTNVSGSIGTLGRKLISGARNAISHIPVIGKYASSVDKNVIGGDDTPAPESVNSNTTPAPEAGDQVESPEESDSTPAPEEAPKEEAPKEEAPKEEAPKEEAPKEEAPKENQQ